MPELRQNMATKEWVLIASERARRPHEYAVEGRMKTHERPAWREDCPFCPGNETRTMADLLRLPGVGPWQVRVFDNKYPALSRSGARVQCVDGVHRKISGVGYHEVLVETPSHNRCTALLEPSEIALTLRAFQIRGREIAGDTRIEQIFFFKNHGASAGSSIEHDHAQLVALPMVPYESRRRIEELRRTFDDEGACPYCRMLEMEEQEQERIVAVNHSFVAFIPYAAFSPFHLWIVPRRHGPTFLDQWPNEIDDLAAIMHEVLARVYHGLGDPDFNYIIRTAPNRDASSAYLHWYVSVVPRVTKSAGFELGSGMLINPSLPEESAAFLRSVELPKAPLLPVVDPVIAANGAQTLSQM